MARELTKLTDAEVKEFLGKYPDWKLVNGQIERTYDAKTFSNAIAFVDEVAKAAEADDHHPDMDIRWKKVTLRMMTHDANGLTVRDTNMAAKADEAFKNK